MSTMAVATLSLGSRTRTGEKGCLSVVGSTSKGEQESVLVKLQMTRWFQQVNIVAILQILVQSRGDLDLE